MTPIFTGLCLIVSWAVFFAIGHSVGWWSRVDDECTVEGKVNNLKREVKRLHRSNDRYRRRLQAASARCHGMILASEYNNLDAESIFSMVYNEMANGSVTTQQLQLGLKLALVYPSLDPSGQLIKDFHKALLRR